jgi:hypothetical protein
VVGAIPAAVGGVGYLFLPSLVLIALAALVPSQPMHSSH